MQTKRHLMGLGAAALAITLSAGGGAQAGPRGGFGGGGTTFRSLNRGVVTNDLSRRVLNGGQLGTGQFNLNGGKNGKLGNLGQLNGQKFLSQDPNLRLFRKGIGEKGPLKNFVEDPNLRLFNGGRAGNFLLRNGIVQGLKIGPGSGVQPFVKPGKFQVLPFWAIGGTPGCHRACWDPWWCHHCCCSWGWGCGWGWGFDMFFGAPALFVAQPVIEEPVVVAAPAQADLVAAAYRVVGTHEDGDGMKTTILVTVRNIGGGAASPSVVAAQVGENEAGGAEVGALAPGQEATVTIEAPGAIAPQMMVSVMADATNAVAETSEGNNLRQEPWPGS